MNDNRVGARDGAPAGRSIFMWMFRPLLPPATVASAWFAQILGITWSNPLPWLLPAALLGLAVLLDLRSADLGNVLFVERRAFGALKWAALPIGIGLSVGTAYHPRTGDIYVLTSWLGLFAVWGIVAVLGRLFVQPVSDGARWRRAAGVGLFGLALANGVILGRASAGGGTELPADSSWHVVGDIPWSWSLFSLVGAVAALALLRAATRERDRWRGAREGEHMGDGWVRWADGTSDQVPNARELWTFFVIVREHGRSADAAYRGRAVIDGEVWRGPLAPRVRMAAARADVLNALALVAAVHCGAACVAALWAVW
jgi:hypothetical protein